jgi:hypothetical protein
MKNPDALRIFFPEFFGGKYNEKNNENFINIKRKGNINNTS